jgi:hypothetical protein
VFGNKVLRRISGDKRKEATGQRILYNEVLILCAVYEITLE